jgi:two-component system phosphate regulon response regulator PhoB
MTRKQILLIEDEKDMAELVARRLTREHYDVNVAHDGRDGLERARSSRPDLVLLDIMLPGMSGTEVLRELRNDPRTVGLPVVMMTARGEDSDVVVGLQLGADDYVTKPFSLSVLVARVAAALRRAEALLSDRRLLSIGDVEIDQDRHVVTAGSRSIDLTATEFRLLVAIVAARGRVLNRNQLIDQALGMDAVVTDRTIDVHMTSLRRKLGRSRKHIRTVRGVGYSLAMDANE